jgi:hypothetical protein
LFLQWNEIQYNIRPGTGDKFHPGRDLFVIALGNADNKHAACALLELAFTTVKGFQISFGPSLGVFEPNMDAAWRGPPVSVPDAHINDSARPAC